MGYTNCALHPWYQIFGTGQKGIFMYVDTHLGTASLTMKLPFKVRRVSKICNSSVSLRRGLNRKKYNDTNRYGNNVANSLVVRLTTMRQ